jgi:hypothetical protein
MSKLIFKDGKLLFWRLGNVNSVKQTHWHTEHHQPPVKRGIWAFPYPYYDLFFCYHQYTKRLPKIYRKVDGIGIKGCKEDYTENLSDEDARLYYEKEEELVKNIKKILHPSLFYYSGGFYSHISIHNEIDYDKWFYWEDVKSWGKLLIKGLYVTEKFNEHLVTMRYSFDHIEVFIPNY